MKASYILANILTSLNILKLHFEIIRRRLLANKFNSLVEVFNSMVEVFNSMVEVFNSPVEKFNSPVWKFNSPVRKFNSLVEKFNSLTVKMPASGNKIPSFIVRFPLLAKIYSLYNSIKIKLNAPFQVEGELTKSQISIT